MGVVGFGEGWAWMVEEREGKWVCSMIEWREDGGKGIVRNKF